MILLIDNYDSFSYNLYQILGSVNPDIMVIRNDEKTVEQIEEWKPAGIILSPGPGRPEDAGICIEAVRKIRGKIPILGVCLGHQSIACAYGATVGYAKMLMHGKQSEAEIDTTGYLFSGLPETIMVGRYHSLAVEEKTLPPELTVTAHTKDGEVMAMEDRKRDVIGLQFHPESILTPEGPKMLENWIHHLPENGRSAAALK